MLRLPLAPTSVVICMLVVLVCLVVALLADYIVGTDPLEQNLRHRLMPPYWLARDASDNQPRYLLGSDELGRDILSRIVYGSRVSLVVGFVAVCIGAVFGGLMGLVSGYFGGYTDETIMMIVDIQLAFPFILLAIAVIAVLGPSFANLVVLIGISGWVTYARILRAQTLGIKEKEFIESIRCLGGTNWRILFRHILPNTLSPLIVVGSLDLARTILLESTLSFLGLGVQPPTPSWGGMMSEGRQYLGSAWWIATFPGMVLMSVTLSVSRLGDWLRDILDPMLRTG
jgi:peptide/nickel transport system permease protein